MRRMFAVVLAGCGHLDGGEIRESVLSLLALEQAGIGYKIFAPDQNQFHVINHYNKEIMECESRNVLIESARIARGDITELSQLNVLEFDALLIPGGFGVAKNLSNFAFNGSQGHINPTLLTIIQSFANAKKPIGAICIAPAIVSLALGHLKPVMTIGSDPNTANEIEKTSAIHQSCETNKCVIDSDNKIVTTPAYMGSDVSLVEVFSGISALVDGLIGLIDKKCLNTSS